MNEKQIINLRKIFCPNCDGSGATPVEDGYGGQEAEQCQWCDEFTGLMNVAKDSPWADIEDPEAFVKAAKDVAKEVCSNDQIGDIEAEAITDLIAAVGANRRSQLRRDDE